MEEKITSMKENSKNSMNEPANNDFVETCFRKIFCPLCLRFPEYYIRLESDSNFSLVHTCLKGEIKEDFNKLEKSCESFLHKCVYCSCECKNICIKCKYFICKECAKRHNKSPYTLNTEKSETLNEDKDSILTIENSQYFCDKHLLEFKFYCPICKINLCEECKNEHFHMNCPSLFSKNLEFKNISEPSNKFYKELCQIAEIFYNCYSKNSKNKMTLNILMNANLAINILKFIELDAVSQGKEIKNNYFEGIDEKVYLCSHHSELEVKNYYSKLINNIYKGSIYDYKKLIEIINKYEELNYLNLSLYNYYSFALSVQNSLLINMFDIIDTKIEFDNINLILSKGLRTISFLKLKNKYTDFCLQLMKIISLKMNYKLDIELRRKVGNIIGKIILKNFHCYLEKLEPTKKMLTLSLEEIGKQYAKCKTPVNKLNGNKNNISKSELLKLRYKKALNMLKDEVQKELMDTENKDYKYNMTNNISVISFKILSDDKEEIKKAILCNLFFYIKWKMENKFNDQIHNIILEINSLLAKELKKIENTENVNKNGGVIKTNKENIKIEIHKYDLKTQLNENHGVIKNENVLCPNKFQYLNELNRQIKLKDEKFLEIEDILEDEDDESILKSSVDEFIKLLKKLKSTYMIMPGISVQQSLNLFFDGKKEEILKGKISADNMNSLIDYSNKLSSKDNKEIEAIANISQKNRKDLEKHSNLLYTNMNIIEKELEMISQFFDIKKLLTKYKIKQPVDPVKVINYSRSIVGENNDDEIHYLILVISQLFIDSKIKNLNSIEKELEKVNLNEITKNNIIKKNIIKSFIDNINSNSGITFPLIDWDELQKSNDFLNDKNMNDLIIKYVRNESKENYIKDLNNLINPYCKIIDLSGEDQ